MAILGPQLEERVDTNPKYRVWRWCSYCTEVSRGFTYCDCDEVTALRKQLGATRTRMQAVPRTLGRLLEATYRISTLEAVDALFLEHLPKLLARHRG